MYRVMIVDDEPEIRTALRLKINWENLGFQIVKEASDGEEVLEFLAANDIDVLITDIRMPILDGIELIKQCSANYPEILIVILSGYSDFTYAKAAIQFGAVDYLLKPVVPDELIAILQNILIELQKRKKLDTDNTLLQWHAKQTLSVLREQLLLQLVNGEWESQTAMKERARQLQLDYLLPEGKQLQICSVEMRIPLGRLEDGMKDQHLLRLAFQMLCREIGENSKCCVSVFHNPNLINMVHFVFNLHTDQDNQPMLEQFSSELTRNIERYLRVEAVIGFGSVCREIEDLKSGYASSLLSWSQRHPVSALERKESNAYEINRLFSPETEKKVLVLIENGDLTTFTELANSEIQNHSDRNYFQITFIVTKFIMSLTSVASKYNIDSAQMEELVWNCQYALWKLEAREQLVGRIIELARFIVEKIKESSAVGGASIVKAVQRYIDKNHAKELSLVAMSEMFHISPKYLSETFKKYIGQTFSEYITEIRMNAAIHLLSDAAFRLEDIAELIGYSDASYFSNAFKKKFGCSPNAYRRRIQQ